MANPYGDFPGLPEIHEPTPEETETAHNAFLYSMLGTGFLEAISEGIETVVGLLDYEIPQERKELIGRALRELMGDILGAAVKVVATPNADIVDVALIGAKFMTNVSTGTILPCLAAGMGSPHVGKVKDLCDALDMAAPDYVTDDSIFFIDVFDRVEYPTAGDFLNAIRAHEVTEGGRDMLREVIRKYPHKFPFYMDNDLCIDMQSEDLRRGDPSPKKDEEKGGGEDPLGELLRQAGIL